MSYGFMKSWVMMAWLAGLVAVLLVDAIRKLIGRDTAVSFPNPQGVKRVHDTKGAKGIHDLFDNADEVLPPEFKPGMALCDRQAAQEEYKKSA